jgi:hypothetical protein
MSTDPRSPRPGAATFGCFLLGTFVGILLHKLALGMILGFFVGAAIDASRRKRASGSGEGKPGDSDRS